MGTTAFSCLKSAINITTCRNRMKGEKTNLIHEWLEVGVVWQHNSPMTISRKCPAGDGTNQGFFVTQTANQVRDELRQMLSHAIHTSFSNCSQGQDTCTTHDYRTTHFFTTEVVTRINYLMMKTEQITRLITFLIKIYVNMSYLIPWSPIPDGRVFPLRLGGWLATYPL